MNEETYEDIDDAEGYEFYVCAVCLDHPCTCPPDFDLYDWISNEH